MSLTKQKLAPGYVLSQSPSFMLCNMEAHTTVAIIRGKIYWTGYGKFFAESYTPECDTVSWSTWISVSAPPLTSNAWFGLVAVTDAH